MQSTDPAVLMNAPPAHLPVRPEWLATTTSLVAVVNFVILYVAMTRISGGLETRSLAVLCGKLLAAGAVMAGVCLAANHFIFHDLSAMRQISRALWLGVVIGAAAMTYFGVARLLHVAEAKESLDLVLRRFRRNKA